MGKFDGKVVVITGCSAGLGKQTAKRFALEGAKLAICDKVADKLAVTAEECKALGAEVLCMTVDLTEYAQIEMFVDATVKQYGTIDVLINNAVTIFAAHPLEEHTIDELNTTMHSGLYATWHMMKLCLPYLKGRHTSIINFGSGAGDLGLEGYAAYAATKEAIRGLSRVAAREWGKYGIRVNIVNPSAVTDTVRSYLDAAPEEARAAVEGELCVNPLGRPGDPYEDITPAILFLASDESRWVTGQTLMVEGGGNIHG